ncbi:hypothetical protein HYPSUDRAFT_1005435 [Hypholoma sublateritium FD-334 SS-4]|uniref:Uncharacterized protein n=1 Tax=Hypholoma sublateritium (strain FD-334 SS-4) TaxID=945553 RepID=A0A0D2PBT8_HYPSF|nr:hypothetical protein HYPSUDRAFT_1005435 [Hypholoma sublateritium FD-334 SS-4]
MLHKVLTCQAASIKRVLVQDSELFGYAWLGGHCRRRGASDVSTTTALRCRALCIVPVLRLLPSFLAFVNVAHSRQWLVIGSGSSCIARWMIANVGYAQVTPLAAPRTQFIADERSLGITAHLQSLHCAHVHPPKSLLGLCVIPFVSWFFADSWVQMGPGPTAVR